MSRRRERGRYAVPQDYYNVDVMLRNVAKHGGEIGVCGRCTDARAIADAELSKPSTAVRSNSSWTGPSGPTKPWSSDPASAVAGDFVAEPKTILILGGGVGGVVTARELRKRLPRPHRVVLVDRERDHLFAPSLLWLMVGQRRAESIRKPLRRLERKGIEVRIGEVERLDAEARRAVVAGDVIYGDYVVISLGAELHPDAIPGLAEAGYNFYTLPGAEAFWNALSQFRAGRIVVLTATPAYKCPAAPYEAAMLIEAFCRRRGAREAVQIDIYAAEAAPMGVAGPEVSGAVKQLLARKGIPYHPEHQVTTLDAAAKRLTFANGALAEFDLLAYVPPYRPPPRGSGQRTRGPGRLGVRRSPHARNAVPRCLRNRRCRRDPAGAW